MTLSPCYVVINIQGEEWTSFYPEDVGDRFLRHVCQNKKVTIKMLTFSPLTHDALRVFSEQY